MNFFGAVLFATVLGLNINTVAAADMTSVTIVDVPRPEPKWGFAPGSRRIQPGTWVTWSNDGQDPHTVTAVDGAFDSGNLDPSEGFSWFFDQPGTFRYICAVHPWMKGTIIVSGPSAVSSQSPTIDPPMVDDQPPPTDDPPPTN
jgi:plastocyanin